MLITNATLITWGSDNRILSDHALYLDGDRIAELGPTAELQKKYASAETLDARGQLVMPGNICAHTHFYGAFARGMAIPGDAPKDFPEILERLWWKLDRALTMEDVRYSALVCLVDAIKHGTTTLIDHHASPNAIDGSLDVIAEAVTQAGLRACLCYEVTDRNGPDGAKAGIAENVRFIKSQISNPAQASQIASTFGLHASLTLSDETLEACRNAYDGGFHIHVAEHEADEYDSLKKSGTRVVDRLGHFSILGKRTIVAHCVHIDYREAEILRETGTWVTHQPRSNMNNAVGAADVDGLLRMGINVCLGNDGFSNAMWEEWKAAYLLHKVANRDPRRAGGYNIARMAITNNAALAGMFFPRAPMGVLAPGAFADIIFVDYHATTPLTAGNLPWHIIFGFESSMVTTTICGGKVLMKDRQLLFLDEAELTAKSRELAKKTWDRIVW
ncbi:MAG TPA: putative aminohydrolase SsnA [Anaerolineales bacterium]|nr:putative aminohydrolase SsnA [Anaerolineales bacterium]HLB45873.1 putative aminohydrolase SsnA [Anaerolineales bacterium]